MPPDLTFRAIAGFRLVTADPVRLATFYRAIGFSVGESMPIPAAEMQTLGLAGAGSRIGASLGPNRVDLDVFAKPGCPYPEDADACSLIFQHLALVTDDAKIAWNRAREAGAVAISRDGPITLPKSSGGVTAVKFRDPDGHPLEFLQFPPGAYPSWKGKGILGIDHSAISVRDIAASQHFYARQGLRAVDATLNNGPTQDALDGLDDVDVDVVPMNPADKTPHVELLGYRHPVDMTSRPMSPNDVAATRIVWQSSHDALLRDPDGHLHELSREDRLRAGIASPP